MQPKEAEQRFRPPAVAGQFYPAAPEQLRESVVRLLTAAKARPATPKVLIAPHAGYAYSGSVAAEAFAALGNAATIERVVVIGPAHYVTFRGVAMPTAAAFETPLGRVPIDSDALAAAKELPAIVAADAPHRPEHALEVELPFLQTVLDSFALVPLLVGDARPQDVAEVLGRLWGGAETLVVVSSDLSHYLPYEASCRIDAETAEAIERGDWRRLSAERACGHLPVAGVLIEAERRGLAPRRLALMNSGDTAGPRDRVVGYGAWMFE